MRQRGFITVNMHGVRKAAAECTKETKRTNRILYSTERKKSIDHTNFQSIQLPQRKFDELIRTNTAELLEREKIVNMKASTFRVQKAQQIDK